MARPPAWRLADVERAGVAVAVGVVATAHAVVVVPNATPKLGSNGFFAVFAVRAVRVHVVVVAGVAVGAHALRAFVAPVRGADRGRSGVIVRRGAGDVVCGLPVANAVHGAERAALEELRLATAHEARASVVRYARLGLEAPDDSVAVLGGGGRARRDERGADSVDVAVVLVVAVDGGDHRPAAAVGHVAVHVRVTRAGARVDGVHAARGHARFVQGLAARQGASLVAAVHRLGGGAAVEARAILAAVDNAVTRAGARLRAGAAGRGAGAPAAVAGPLAVHRVDAGGGAVALDVDVGRAVFVGELLAEARVVRRVVALARARVAGAVALERGVHGAQVVDLEVAVADRARRRVAGVEVRVGVGGRGRRGDRLDVDDQVVDGEVLVVRRLAEAEAHDVDLGDVASLPVELHLVARRPIAEVAATRATSIQDGGGRAEGEVASVVVAGVGAPRGHRRVVVGVLRSVRDGVDAGELVGGVDRGEVVGRGHVAVPGGRVCRIGGNAVEVPLGAAHVHGDGAHAPGARGRCQLSGRQGAAHGGGGGGGAHEGGQAEGLHADWKR